MVYNQAFHKGRGALSNATGRYEERHRVAAEDGWHRDPADAPRTQVQSLSDRTIISRNQSPDVPFEQSINPYRGCEHGCIYCYARPTHAWLGLSPGLDFETRLFSKPNAAALLQSELSKPGYRCRPIALGTNTDPYQPIEKRLRITRELLETLLACRHPVSIVTKGELIERDVDLLAELAEQNLVTVMISITTLSVAIKQTLEPRAAGPKTRLELIKTLHNSGVPAGVLVAPVIPALTDHEMESILEAAVDVGATAARYLLLRLPQEVDSLFNEWLDHHHPAKRERALSLLRQSHGGRVYDNTFGIRGRGSGPYADLLERRFEIACRKLGITEQAPLDVTRFVPPAGQQLPLL